MVHILIFVSSCSTNYTRVKLTIGEGTV